MRKTLPRHARSSAFWAPADQVLSSITGFVVMVVGAHVASADALGFLATIVILQGVGLGLQRAALGDSYVMLVGAQAEDETRAFRSLVPWTLGLGCLCAITIALSATVAFPSFWLLATLFAVTQPFLMIQDLVRYVLLARGSARSAFVLDLLWVLTMGGILGGVAGLGELSVRAIITANLIGCSLSATWGMASYSRSLPAGARHGRAAVAGRAATLAGEYAVGAGFTQLATLFVGVLIGAASLGAFRLAVALVGPLVTVLAVLRVPLMGRYAQIRDMSRRVKAALRLGVVLASVVLASGLVVGSLGEPIFRPLAPKAVGDLATLIMLAGLAEGARLFWLPVADLLRAYGRPREILQRRAWATVILCMGMTLGAARWGAAGALLGLAFGQALTLVSYLRAGRNLVRRHDVDRVGSVTG